MFASKFLTFSTLVSLSTASLAMDDLSINNIEKLQVSTSASNLVGAAISASQGSISEEEFQFRPLLRNGELLELVPGMVATQHSGSGKANQLFLRGFNLDHGTDFATFYDGMPVNMRSHGHGQGYTDLNFIIAETVEKINFKKGPYYSDVGDFSGAGSAHFASHSKNIDNLFGVTIGQDQYYRSVFSKHISLDKQATISTAAELQSYDGPWSDISEDVRKKNALLKYTNHQNEGVFSVSFMGYDNKWNSADQIPSRAVDNKFIDRLGSITESTGGSSSRYSLNVIWNSELLSFNAYAIDYQLQLFSDFTYFLDDPVNGDQFEQVDDRNLYGFNLHRHFYHNKGRTTLGFNSQYDDIHEVGLFSSLNRNRTGAVRLDRVKQQSASVFIDHSVEVLEDIQANFGARYDYYHSEVASKIPVNVNQIDLTKNKGTATDDLFSFKANLVYSFNEQTELYLSTGQGFHSNDARGTVSFIDPSTGLASSPVNPLVRSYGSEVGVRWTPSNSLNISAALWQLSLDSELVFVGDAGGTEASDASRRHGIEFTAFWRLNDYFTLDAEYAQSTARFKQVPNGQQHVPGSLDRVIQFGVSAQNKRGLVGSLRMRHIGARTLEESGQLRSEPSTTINALLSYSWQDFEIKAELLNALDSHDHDIDYFYASRLPGESSAGIEDVHFHPLAPRSLRVTMNYRF